MWCHTRGLSSPPPQPSFRSPRDLVSPHPAARPEAQAPGLRRKPGHHFRVEGLGFRLHQRVAASRGTLAHKVSGGWDCRHPMHGAGAGDLLNWMARDSLHAFLTARPPADATSVGSKESLELPFLIALSVPRC